MAQQTKAHCSKCLGERNHAVLYSESQTETDQIETEPEEPGDFYEISWTDYFSLIKCLGCNHISLMHTSTFSETNEKDVKYYPPAISRPKPKWINELCDILSRSNNEMLIGELLTEIYVALYNNSIRLATMGIRSLLEHVMIAKVGDTGTFTNNLKEFVENGYISRSQKDLIDRVLELGHATTHRSYKPKSEELNTAIDICENIIEMIYIYTKRPTPDLPSRKK